MNVQGNRWKLKMVSFFLRARLAMLCYAKSLQSCLTLCDPRQQPTRLPVPGILQARILECVAISFSNACR